jgi:glycosyltransferase involved in cell wall biosynthesis
MQDLEDSADIGSITGACRICIVTPDIIGPVNNGGIGTAYTNLALSLARRGYDVTILYLLGDYCERGSIEQWCDYYSHKNIRFVGMPQPDELVIQAPYHPRLSYLAYLYLRNKPFDVIHFPEWSGFGFYTVLAKSEGLAFQASSIVIGTHSPTLWHTLSNAELIDDSSYLDRDYMERRSVELADLVVSPSQYLVDWMREQKWSLPGCVKVQPNILAHDLRRDFDASQLHQINELVFFGRLEARKGLKLFCDALDRLLVLLGPDGVYPGVTFLGKDSRMHGKPSRDYLKGRASRWPFEWRMVSDRDQAGALDYLGKQGRLAVIPSLSDNSPYTVLECLGRGIPFLASKVGGIPELIHEEGQEDACFELRPQALAEKLYEALRGGVRLASPRVDFEADELAWAQIHEELVANARSDKEVVETPVTPLVSVCVTHYNRPKLLPYALESLRNQDYSNFEVILIDDGSTDQEALAYLESLESEFAERGWQMVRQENRYLGAARNTAARHAKGEYLLFMDDDNIAKSNEISTFVNVAYQTGADILTCVLDVFEGDGGVSGSETTEVHWVPLGPNISSGLFRNVFGDANALVRRDVFEELGGFTEDYGVGHEDWEFRICAGNHTGTARELSCGTRRYVAQW